MRLSVKPINRGADEQAITSDAGAHNWLTGTVDGLPYAVKVWDEASEHGIDNGRVIKLLII